MSTKDLEATLAPRTSARIMPWMKLSLRTRIDPVVQLLSFDDQRHFIWLMMMEMEGVMDTEYGSDKIRDMVIAKALGLTVETALEVRCRLQELLLIDSLWKTCGQAVGEKNGDTCDASQGASHVTLGKRHTTSVDRTRKYRAKQKAAKLQALGVGNSHSDVSVTSQCVTSDALDRERDKELNKPAALTTEPKSVDNSEKEPDPPPQPVEVTQDQIDAIVGKFTKHGYRAKLIIYPTSIGLFTDWIQLGITRRQVDQAIHQMHQDTMDPHTKPVEYVDKQLRESLNGLVSA